MEISENISEDDVDVKTGEAYEVEKKIQRGRKIIVSTIVISHSVYNMQNN